jgi:hypothetical protein
MKNMLIRAPNAKLEKDFASVVDITVIYALEFPADT